MLRFCFDQPLYISQVSLLGRPAVSRFRQAIFDQISVRMGESDVALILASLSHGSNVYDNIMMCVWV